MRRWTGWYRHITLCLLALAFLVSIAVQERNAAAPPNDGLTPPRAQAAVAPPDLVPLSVPEVRHLLAQLLFPLPSGIKLVLAWSAWRRASMFHTRRRLKAG